MGKDDVFVINEGLEMRTSSSGKSKFTVRIVSEPIAINTDPAFLAMAPAKRMAEFLRQKVAAVTAAPAANTLRARRTELAAFVRGKPWAVERFSGGRMGSMPPMRSENALNNSGRLAKGIAATKGKDGGSWRVNVPSNRLDETTSGGFERVWNRLVQLVPEFGANIATNIVQEGVEWSMRNMIKKAKASSSKLQIEIFRQAWSALEKVGEILAA